jgi:hypothetical protein
MQNGDYNRPPENGTLASPNNQKEELKNEEDVAADCRRHADCRLHLGVLQT